MSPAYNPDAPVTDQAIGANAFHAAQASRFNTLDSRTIPTPVGASVTEALSEYRKGNFTLVNLKELAFGMNCQVVEGRNVNDLVIKIQGLDQQIAELTTRAVNAEGAFAGKNELTEESLREITFARGFQMIRADDLSALVTKANNIEKQNGDLVIRAQQAESAFTAAQSELDALRASKG